MNMLISWRAVRGERASPVLFLHRSDARGRGREWRKERRRGRVVGGGKIQERKKEMWRRRRRRKKARGRGECEDFICEILEIKTEKAKAEWQSGRKAKPATCYLARWRQINHPH